VTLTLFEIGQEAIDTIRNIRQETEGRNVLRMVNPEAEKFLRGFIRGRGKWGRRWEMRGGGVGIGILGEDEVKYRVYLYIGCDFTVCIGF
jgi:hypothetical protein